MQTQNELKEILLEAYKEAGEHEFTGEWQFDKWHEKYSSKILALGKPEPLAKNKDCDGDFYCNFFERGKISAKCHKPCSGDVCWMEKS